MQWLTIWPEDAADVGGVVFGGVEVGVVGDREGQPVLHRAGRHDQVLDGGPELIFRQPPGDLAPDLGPGAVAGVEELVQAARGEQMSTAGQQAVGRGRQVEHAVADCDPDPEFLGVMRGGVGAVGERPQSERVIRRYPQPRCCLGHGAPHGSWPSPYAGQASADHAKRNEVADRVARETDGSGSV